MQYKDGAGEGKKRDWTNLNLVKMKKTESFGNKHESWLDFSLDTSVRWKAKKTDKHSEKKGITDLTSKQENSLSYIV